MQKNDTLYKIFLFVDKKVKNVSEKVMVQDKKTLKRHIFVCFRFSLFMRGGIKTLPEMTPGFLFTSSRCELFYKLHVPLETCAASNFIMNVHKKSNRKSTFPH